jgi:two-component system, chemotaxis family, sensor kinase CheA
MTAASDREPPAAHDPTEISAPREAPGTAAPAASELAAWVREDTASMVETCDKVFGVASMSVAIGAVVCAFLGKSSALSAVLVLAFPLLNLVVSRISFGRRHSRVEILRVTVNAPLVVATYVMSDGILAGMWLPMLIQVAGGSVAYPVMTRSVKPGYAFTLWNVALLALSAALDGQLGSTLVLWRGVAMIIVGFVLSTVVARLADTVIAARHKRHEAETHKRDLEVSLRKLDEGNRGMRLVLDSVAQGFLTIDLDGVMAGERSAVVDRWFGEPAPGATFDAFIERHAPDLAAWFALGLESIRDGFLPLELCLEQMPRRFSAAGRTFEIAYSPILRDGQMRTSGGAAPGSPGEMRILLIVSDVTEHVIRERAEREQREIVTLFQRITSDRAGFDEFLDEAAALVDALAAPTAPDDPVHERRMLHTLKGNCAILGFERYAELCHRVEGELAEAGSPDATLTAAQRAALADAWRELTRQVTRLLGEARRNVVEVELPELARIVDKAHQGAASRDLATVLTSWSHEPVVRRFERLGRYATALARRLGKGEIDLVISGDDLRLDAARWAAFWAAAVHAVRNAVDHGFDGPHARAAAGKPERPRLAFAAARAAGQLTLTISDDGGGIDWDLVRARATALGMPADGPADLQAAVFADGFSTRQEVTAVAGRGVGMAALRAAVNALGGSIHLDSRLHHGTTLSCRFPDAEPHNLPLPMRLPTQPIRPFV